MLIWTGLLSLLSCYSLLLFNCDSILPTGTEAGHKWGFRSKGRVTSPISADAPGAECGCCCYILQRSVWSPRCNPINIMSAYFLLWMGQNKGKHTKKAKLLLLNGRLPEIWESRHWHNISSQKGELQAKILHLHRLQLSSQSASRFPLSDMWPSYFDTQESSCRWARCRQTVVTGSLVRKASLYSVCMTGSLVSHSLWRHTVLNLDSTQS